jgi:drug/metabolite transporter (DMT)-like permease
LNLGVPLGLSSGLCWGAADFFGGMQSRRLPALTVAFWSQVAGALGLVAALTILGPGPGTEAAGVAGVAGIAWGLVAGVASGCALVLFYRGLAEGIMSVVAPVSACGAVVPVAAALLTGDQPNAVAGLGVLAAVAGVVLVSRTRPTAPTPGTGALDHPGHPATARRDGSGDRERPAAQRSGRVLVMALGSALGFGLFYVFVDAGTSGSGGAPLWVIAGARASSLVMLSTIALVGNRPALRWPGRRIGPVALVGVGDTGANLLFAYAAIGGNLAVVGVLGSLYPVATVVLARWLLGERLSAGQNAGVVLALTGVGLLAVA